VAERILIVDDDPSIVNVVERVVRSLGFEPVVHTDPRAAATVTNVAVVLSDFNMPHLNGVELLRLVRQQNPHAVRVMFTALSDMTVAQRAVNDGEVFRLLSKPWQLSELKGVITQSIETWRLGEDNRRLHGELAAKNAALLDLNQSLERQVMERTNGLLEGMIRALDYRDTETQWHSYRVARVTRRIAIAAGLQGDDLLPIEQGALLHDVGKIGVRDSILLKQGPLTPEEWVEMRQHPEIGWRMLAHIPYLKPAAMVVHQHQERWDGKGYPQGLVGESIVVGARLFALADTLDAITSDRPYRKAQPIEVATHEIRRLAGTQFDPHLAEIFLAIPTSEWLAIRAEVEALEAEDKKKWEGRPRILSAREAVLGVRS
jgi:response regulator RpfG family c-di-GMP phosphodiesterase